MKSFLYQTETPNRRYEHRVYAQSLESSIVSWIELIEDQEGEVYSFGEQEVAQIKRQCENDLKHFLKSEPYFLLFKLWDTNQLVQIFEIKRDVPDLIAQISYLSTESGGRNGYVRSGYRSQVKFEGRDEQTSGEQIFLDRNKVYPGETARAEIRIIAKEIFEASLDVGQKFGLFEGLTIIGYGNIIDIVNTSLLKP